MTSAPLDAWLASKRNRGCLPQTVRQYEGVVRLLYRAIEPRRLSREPRRWTERDALAIRSALHDSHWAVHLIADFARFRGNRVFNDVGLPRKSPVRRVRWLTLHQAEQIVRLTRHEPLLSLVAILGLGQGLRRIEWQRLRVEDVDLAGRRMLVRGKGRGQPKLAWAPLHPAFSPIFRRFLAYRDTLIARQRATRTSRAIPPEVLVHPTRLGMRAYSASGLDVLVRRIQRLLEAEGEMVRLSSHMFRRSGASLLEKVLREDPQSSRDGIYRTVQGFLRHDNLATTMLYLEEDPVRQQQAIDRLGTALPWTGVDHRERKSSKTR